MTVHPIPPAPPEIASRMSSLAASGMPRPELIWQMRLAGLHIIDCMRLMSTIYGLSRRDAKRIVHESDAWASMRGEYDAFHDMAEAAAVKAGFEVVKVPEDLQKAS